MRVLPALSAAVVSLYPGGIHAQTPRASAPDPYKNEAIVFERSETTYRMHADGTGERDTHAVIRIQSEGAAQQFGVITFAYASDDETPAIKFVRVHKPDGSVVETPVADAIDMPADVTRQAPLYSDLKEKHLPVRSLSPGDTLDYEIDTSINKAEAPGEFWGVYHFTAPGTIVILAEVLTLEAPSSKYVQVWSPKHPPTVTENDGTRTYVWNVAQLVTAPKNSGDEAAKATPPKDPDEDDEGRKVPSVAWTTFHSWAEVGDWYRSLALTRADPDDAIRAKANELTKDAKTQDDQVRALYGYVSAHNRYIGIDFGIGRYQPHHAAEVLTNQYGDCKDKDTLLEALLRAKGFTTAPALIGVGIAPVPEVPSPAVFNHVITTVELAGSRVWLDSTPQAAPFRYLVPQIRDQKSLVIPAVGAADLAVTPAGTPYPLTAQFEAEGTLDKDGKMTAKIKATYHDDDEIVVRALAQNVAPADWDKASQYISSATGFGGTTSNTEFANAPESSQPIVMSYSYEKHPYGDWKMLNIVPLLPVAEFSLLDTDSPAPQTDIQLGSPRTLTAVSRIHLPEGYHPDLPDPVHAKTDFATFDQVYRFDGKTITVERTIGVLAEKIPKDDWKKYQAFTKDIHLNEEVWIPLIPPTTPSEAKVAGTSTRPSIAARPAAGAKDTTSSAEKPPVPPPNPPPPEVVKKGPEAIREYVEQEQARKALPSLQEQAAAHPEEARYAILLAAAEQRSGDADAARQTVQKFLDAHPAEAAPAEYLASLETEDGDYGTALRTLQAAAKQNPDDPALQLSISDALRRLNRNEDAAAAAKSVLDKADTPELLNNAAYVLSEMGLDLDTAEAASRKSIDLLEARSATLSTEQANSRSFADANLLIAAWDTLGWILFEEGKYEDARPYLAAAWRASLRAEIGEHLAQVEDRTGAKDQAATTYALAQAALDRTSSQEVRNGIDSALARLRAGGAKPAPAAADALQKLRTWNVPHPAGVSGWGTFRLEITTTGVIEAQQMSGDAKAAGIVSTLQGMKFPELLPPASKAHLLRSAVVSCSEARPCDVILVPDGGLGTEAR